MATVEEILTQARQLDPQSRLQIVQELLVSLEPEGDALNESEWIAAWLPEIKSRLVAYERGETSATDWREVIARIRQSLDASQSS